MNKNTQKTKKPQNKHFQYDIRELSYYPSFIGESK